MASTIQFGGIISGLKTADIIDALMSAEKAPLTRLQNQATALQTRRSALVGVGGALSTLLTKMRAFTTSQAGAARTAVSSDASVLSASASPNAVVGQYRIGVDRLATATRATSTAAIGSAITDAIAHADVSLDPTKSIANLNLPGTITSGQVTIIVDGAMLHVAVDPSKNLAAALDSIASAIQAQTNLTDPSANVTASVVANRVQLAMTGGGAAHTIRFGAPDDTSNALGVLGLSSLLADGTTNPTLTGTTALGVTKTAVALDSAGLSGLTSTTTGKLTINGVGISYDTTTDSLSTLVSRINSAQAGVIASLDRTNDKLVLTRTTTGAQAMSLDDTGTLATALNLAPRTTNAQVIGQSAQLTVDGRTIVSDSNHVTNSGIEGVTIDLAGETALGTTRTLTIGIDRTSIKAAVKDFVAAFNALGDVLDTLTENTPGTNGKNGTSGPLASDNRVTSLFLDLRTSLMKQVPGLTGTLTSLASIGIGTGAVGAAVGSTDRLVLDETKLDKALDTDPSRVALLLGDSAGVISPVADKVGVLAGASGFVQIGERDIDSQLRQISTRENSEQDRIDGVQASLERKYAALEAMLAKLQTQQSAVSAQIGSMTSSSSSNG